MKKNNTINNTINDTINNTINDTINNTNLSTSCMTKKLFSKEPQCGECMVNIALNMKNISPSLKKSKEESNNNYKKNNVEIVIYDISYILHNYYHDDEYELFLLNIPYIYDILDFFKTNTSTLIDIYKVCENSRKIRYYISEEFYGHDVISEYIYNDESHLYETDYKICECSNLRYYFLITEQFIDHYLYHSKDKNKQKIINDFMLDFCDSFEYVFERLYVYNYLTKCNNIPKLELFNNYDYSSNNIKNRDIQLLIILYIRFNVELPVEIIDYVFKILYIIRLGPYVNIKEFQDYDLSKYFDQYMKR